MASPTQPGGFFSTPGFKIYQRGLLIQAIQHFRGINTFRPITSLPGDWAQDCLNVIVSANGMLSKMRLPQTLLAQPNIEGFWDFQQPNGVRQVLFQVDAGGMYYIPSSLTGSPTLIEQNALNSDVWSFVEANNMLFGANGHRMQKWLGVNLPGAPPNYNGWQQWGISAPQNLPYVVQLAPGGALSPIVGGYSYKYAWGNSITGHVGNASQASVSTGLFANESPVISISPLDVPADPQIDTLYWFRTIDGGGDYFHLATVNLTTGAVSFNQNTVLAQIPLWAVGLGPPYTGGKFFQIVDNTLDAELDITTVAPLINGVPSTGKYLVLAQGRIFVAGMFPASQDVIYSGYEQILLGNPPESFPPYNRIHLEIGAESVAGMGVLQIGALFFSSTNRVFFLRGAIEDITLSAPVAFTERLEELPWTMGCMSHYTVQSTPYGIIWLGGDKTVQFWDGRSGAPTDISTNIYAQLRQITPGSEKLSNSSYFNWLERDWYALTVATNGSLEPNRIYFFAMNHQTQQIDIFVSDSVGHFIGIINTPTLQRILCVANLGVGIQQLPVSAVDVGGISQQALVPPTAGVMNAYWRSGYFGNDTPYRSKMWRWLKMITDGDPRAFDVQERFIDDVVYTPSLPQLVGPVKPTASRVGVNVRANRFSVEIDFPGQDYNVNLLELHVAQIATSDR